jgi:hypothetical protein
LVFKNTLEEECLMCRWENCEIGNELIITIFFGRLLHMQFSLALLLSEEKYYFCQEVLSSEISSESSLTGI